MESHALLYVPCTTVGASVADVIGWRSNSKPTSHMQELIKFLHKTSYTGTVC